MTERGNKPALPKAQCRAAVLEALKLGPADRHTIMLRVRAITGWENVWMIEQAKTELRREKLIVLDGFIWSLPQ